MKHYRKRPFTKRVLTCIKKSSIIEYMGERSHIVVDSNVLYWRLNCTPQQLARAIYALRKQGKLARWDGNRDGILELVPQGEWARRVEGFTRDTLELLDRWEVDEIDGLLRLRQRVDMGKI